MTISAESINDILSLLSLRSLPLALLLYHLLFVAHVDHCHFRQLDELPVTPSGGGLDDGGGSESNNNPFPEAAVDEHRAQRE